MNKEKKNKLVPKLRFPEFKNAGEWEKKTLGEVSQIVRGGSPRPIENFLTTNADGLNWLKIGDVAPESKYITRTKERVIHTALKKTREVLSGDLILSNSMSFGRPYILKIKSCIHDGWIAIRDISKNIDTDYLYYVILSENSQTYFLANAAGAAVKNLNAEIIKLLPVKFSNLTEQQKIADCLSSLDDTIAAEIQMLEAFQLHKKGLMQKLFPTEGEKVPRLQFKEFKNIQNWEEKQLNEICQMRAGKFVKASEISESNNHNLFPCYGGNGLRGYTRSYTHAGVYSLIGRQGALCGNVMLANGKFHATEHAIVVTPNKSIDTNWLFYVLGYLNLNQYATGQAQPGLSVETLEKVKIQTSKSEKEQKKIANCLSSLVELITAQTQKVEKLKAHKKGLMQQLFPTTNETETI